jgi:uncharacterized protein YyaL (SSP411 family)
VKEGGNVPAHVDAHGELQNQNVLKRTHTFQEAATKFGKPEAVVAVLMQQCLHALKKKRLTRPPPHLDDKVITSWNGLFISAASRAAGYLNDDKFLTLATNAATFIRNHLYNPETHLLKRCYREGASEVNGFLDDYSFLVMGLLDLYEATAQPEWLTWCIDLQAKQDELFLDTVRGGYFSTADDQQDILVRSKDDQDGAEPSANSVTASNLLRLGALLEDDTYNHKAEALMHNMAMLLQHYPSAVPTLVAAMMMHLKTPKTFTFVGPVASLQPMATVVRQRFYPNRVIQYIEPNGFLAQRLQSPVQTQASVHVCENKVCTAPITTLQELTRHL